MSHFLGRREESGREGREKEREWVEKDRELVRRLRKERERTVCVSVCHTREFFVFHHTRVQTSEDVLRRARTAVAIVHAKVTDALQI